MNDFVPSPDVVREVLADAIRSTFAAERQLFEERAHERSILFHIGRRLITTVETWRGGWAVDLEYNRQHVDTSLLQDPKRMRLHDRSSPKRSVYPDLIVHKRSGTTRDNNLLVLEAKHDPSQQQRSRDCDKLRAFREQFCYRHVVFLEFPADGAKPRWQWPSDEQTEHGQPFDVFR